MEIESGNIGAVGSQKVSFEGNKLIAEIVADAGPLNVAVAVKIDASIALDLIAKAIPGTFDDAIIEGAKALLSKLS